MVKRVRYGRDQVLMVVDQLIRDVPVEITLDGVDVIVTGKTRNGWVTYDSGVEEGLKIRLGELGYYLVKENRYLMDYMLRKKERKLG